MTVVQKKKYAVKSQICFKWFFFFVGKYMYGFEGFLPGILIEHIWITPQVSSPGAETL